YVAGQILDEDIADAIDAERCQVAGVAGEGDIDVTVAVHRNGGLERAAVGLVAGAVGADEGRGAEERVADKDVGNAVDVGRHEVGGIGRKGHVAPVVADRYARQAEDAAREHGYGWIASGNESRRIA